MHLNDKPSGRRSHLIRIVIYPKDVALIFHVSERTARRKIEEAKIQLGKAKHAFLTIREFCQCFGIKYEEIIDLLNE